MATKSVHKKSLKLLDEFISVTPKAELDTLRNKHENTNIKGLTVEEYFAQFKFGKNNKKYNL